MSKKKLFSVFSRFFTPYSLDKYARVPYITPETNNNQCGFRGKRGESGLACCNTTFFIVPGAATGLGKGEVPDFG